MNIELKPIAESKVRQLGGDVCGVLVRKDEKLAAVDEHGRVQWLQSGHGAEPVSNEKPLILGLLKKRGPLSTDYLLRTFDLTHDFEFFRILSDMLSAGEIYSLEPGVVDIAPEPEGPPKIRRHECSVEILANRLRFWPKDDECDLFNLFDEVCISSSDGKVKAVNGWTKTEWISARADLAKIILQPTQQGSVPKGENDFGLDARYFHEKLSLILRDINSYTPTEMARALGRLAITANPETMREPEFSIRDLIDEPKYRDTTPQPPAGQEGEGDE